MEPLGAARVPYRGSFGSVAMMRYGMPVCSKYTRRHRVDHNGRGEAKPSRRYVTVTLMVPLPPRRKGLIRNLRVDLPGRDKIQRRGDSVEGYRHV